MILDFYDDTGGNLLVAELDDEALEKVAELLESAVEVDKDDRRAFPDIEFGLLRKTASGVERFYPMSDESNALISTFYFGITRDQLPEHIQKVAAMRLSQGLRRFGRNTDVLEKFASGVSDDTFMVEFDEPVVKTASDPSNFILVRGQKVSVSSARQRESLGAFLDDNFHKFASAEKRGIALQCRAYGVPMTDQLEKYAHLDRNPGCNRLLKDRWAQVDDTKRSEVTDSFRTLVEEEDLEKKASLIEEFDQQLGISGLPDGYLTVFGAAVKTRVNSPRFSDGHLEKVAEVCGEETAEALREGKFLSLDEESRKLIAAIKEEVDNE